MSVVKQAIKGVSWMGLFRGATRGIAILKIAVIARLLLPEQYGVYAIALLVLAFLEIFTETGINVFLIQRKEKIDEYLNTAWVVSIARGIVIFAGIWVSAPFISDFFQADATRLLRLISFVGLLRGFINPAVVGFQKNLEFHKEFYYRFSTFSFDAVVAITLAYMTRLPESLIWGNIAGVLMELAIGFLFIRPRPRLKFDVAKIKKVVGRGKWVTGSGIFRYLFRQGDDIVVGRLMSESSLGIYQAAYKISSLPISEVADVVAKVFFPVLAKINDKKTIVQAIRTAGVATMAIVVPVGLLIFFFPEEIVRILLGNNWLEAAGVLRVLALFGVLKAFTNFVDSAMLALNKQEYVMTVSAISTVTLFVFVIPLVMKNGIIGAAYSAVIGSAVAVLPSLYFLRKAVNQRS